MFHWAGQAPGGFLEEKAQNRFSRFAFRTPPPGVGPQRKHGPMNAFAFSCPPVPRGLIFLLRIEPFALYVVNTKGGLVSTCSNEVYTQARGAGGHLLRQG